jgi:hypothetical protein
MVDHPEGPRVIAILSLLLVVSLSVLIVRIGAIALTMTGLSDEVARFQALSAFSGAGFTTGESENVVNGPARRRIAAWLIRLGSAGVVTAISTLMLSFVGDGAATWEKLALLVPGLALIVWAGRSARFDRWTRPLIERLLRERAALDLRDYAGLLHLREDWRVIEAEARAGSWLVSNTLGGLGLREENVLVLGVERPGLAYVGAPRRAFRAEPGDVLILYGQAGRLEELAGRRAGDRGAHAQAEEEAREVRAEEAADMDAARD